MESISFIAELTFGVKTTTTFITNRAITNNNGDKVFPMV